MSIKFVVLHLAIFVLTHKVAGSPINDIVAHDESVTTENANTTHKLTDAPVPTVNTDTTTVAVEPNSTTATTTTPKTTTTPVTTSSLPTTTTPVTTSTTKLTTTTPVTTTTNATTPTPITPSTNGTTTTVAPITSTEPVTSPKTPTTESPPHHGRRFDGASFLGGIILTCGLLAIAFVAYKFYKSRTERNYHTL